MDGATRGKKGFGLNSCAKAQSRQGAKERHDVIKGHAFSSNRPPDYQSHWRAEKRGTLISD
ncbi:MAG: hypothetical protein ACLQNE_17225, partial [Thermoguttaceae bacterium]